MTEIVPISDLVASAERFARDKSGSPDLSGSQSDSGVPRLSIPSRGGVLSIGNFDGVHRGHQSLLKQNRQLADRLGGPSVACLFDPHPIAILRPDLAPKRLTSVDERARRMNAMGIDYLVVCETTPQLLGLRPQQFFDALVVDILDCRGIVEGDNFCFGKDRSGDINLLKQLCANHEIQFQVAEMAASAGEMISSTRIRNLIEKGQVFEAGRLMSSPHRIRGHVVSGDRRGRTIGFPTANLAQIDVVVPAPGVYAGIAHAGETQHQAAIHIGESPTFGSGDSSKVEVHLINFDGDLYGQSLTVDFVDSIRGILRFDSADSLAKQLSQDIQSAQRLLETYLNGLEK